MISLLVTSGICALLALLLEIAHAYLADYGQVHLKLNDSHDLEVAGGNPLLFTLGTAGVFIPSACGGRGTCAYCKVRVLQGGGPVLPTETPYLNATEMQENVRLACQVKVRNDLVIRIPEELLSVKEFRAKVTRITQLTPVIKGLDLTLLSPGEGLRFRAGQYIQLEAPRYEKSTQPEFRAFSIASGPGRTDGLDLVITRAPQGLVALYVHDYLKEGQELLVRGPYGDFFLRESDRDILMIATGSGMAPIRSILFQMEAEKIGRKTLFFFGGRSPNDLFFTDELKRWEEVLPDFRFLPVLSRTPDGGAWEGERGRVTDLIRKHVPEGAAMDVYICGAPAMVESSLEELVKKGIPPDRMFYDKFA